MNTLKNLIAAVSFLAGSLVLAAEPIDINTASAEALAEAIRGVGAQKAALIVDHRERYGPFQSVDELTMVRGIGEKTLETSRDNLRVGGDGQ